mgnify:CR=1 FL=1
MTGGFGNRFVLILTGAPDTAFLWLNNILFRLSSSLLLLSSSLASVEVGSGTGWTVKKAVPCGDIGNSNSARCRNVLATEKKAKPGRRPSTKSKLLYAKTFPTRGQPAWEGESSLPSETQCGISITLRIACGCELLQQAASCSKTRVQPESPYCLPKANTIYRSFTTSGRCLM